MGILTGSKILEEIKNGNIEIDPFEESQLNPNSYDLKISNKLLVYKKYDEIDNGEIILDTKQKPEAYEMYMNDEKGFILYPGQLYLGSTLERTYTNKYVSVISGRSSIGRLGLAVHITADIGQIGFNGVWTLEMQVIRPLRIYPGTKICTIYFQTIDGNNDMLYNGRYQHQKDVTASKLFDTK